MALCTITDILINPDGTPALGELVRARIPVLSGAVSAGESGALSNGDWKTFTDSNGSWTLGLPQGATIRLEIPFSGLDAYTIVPSETSAVLADFSMTGWAG